MKQTCKYCAQTEKLDGFGYCIKYSCFERSGLKNKYDNLCRAAQELWFNDSTGQVGRTVTNNYSINHRKADDLKYEAIKLFGFVPLSLLDKMPSKFRNAKWDKNIRW